MVFTVLGLSIVLSLTLLFLTTPNIMEPNFWNETESLLLLLISLSIFAFGCFPLLKMKTIRIEPNRIIFQNYLFGSNIKEVNFKEYDYYKIVHEESENGTFEAVWLIKEEKLADSFSTYQYSNYDALETALPLTYKGELNISPFKQLSCKLGGKI